MKTSLPSLSKCQVIPACFTIFLFAESTRAQAASGVNVETKVFYYGIALAVIILVMGTIMILRKANKILEEQGLPLFEPEFPIFKKMTKASTTVGIVMTLLVLWGIYLVITYTPS